MYGIEREALAFLCAYLSGVAVSASYEMLVVLRMLIRHSWLVINIEDFFYWILTGVYLFYQMYYTIYGTVRWYFVLGVVLGVATIKLLRFWTSKHRPKIQKKLEKSGKSK